MIKDIMIRWIIKKTDKPISGIANGLFVLGRFVNGVRIFTIGNPPKKQKQY